MLVTNLKTKFQELLKNEYPVEEINSFFFLLTESILKMSRLDLALNPGRELSSSEINKFEDSIHRLQNHEPIQYIIGETEFFGLKFRVNEHVLIPRPETEELVQWILDDIGEYSAVSKLEILDIGTGSGCIAISLAKHLPQSKISAIDISEKALIIACENSEMNNVEINFMQADILQKELLEEKYDVIVSNPPYVRELEKQEMQRNVLEHEPEMALYVKDEDPLIFYRKITKLAGEGLGSAGKLYFEINQYLGEETAGILNAEGFKPELKKDIFGNFRMLKGSKNH